MVRETRAWDYVDRTWLFIGAFTTPKGLDALVTAFVAAVSGATYLQTFRLPDSTVDELVLLYQLASDQGDDADRRRRELAGRLERTKEMYRWGDMTREAHVAERDSLENQLPSLKGTTDRATILRKAAAYLRDLPAAWSNASPQQRNAFARLVFKSVEVTDRLVTAVVRRPDFAPFFLQEAAMVGRLDGHADGPADAVTSNEVWIGRKRRASVQHVQNLLLSPTSIRVPAPDFHAASAVVPRRRSARPLGAPAAGRYHQRPFKLTPD